MKLRKLSKSLILIIIIVGCIVIVNKYKDYIGQKKALQIENKETRYEIILDTMITNKIDD